MALVIGSEGHGSTLARSWLGPLLQRTFSHTRIVWNSDHPPDLIVRSHFLWEEPSLRAHEDVPYVCWSGESYPVPPRSYVDPLLEINTSLSGRPNEIWFPQLVAEIPHIRRPPIQQLKRWCAAYAFSHQVTERECLFQQLRALEPTCYAFGHSCHTRDNPFEIPIEQRGDNWKHFTGFAFNVAMENTIATRYITEKIGHAFNAGSVPIYWGDRATVEEFFNPAAFINVCDFPTPDAAGEFAVQVWRDPQKLQRYLDAPVTINRTLADYEAVRTAFRPWQTPIIECLRETFPDLS
jgi:hypothetical protein